MVEREQRGIGKCNAGAKWLIFRELVYRRFQSVDEIGDPFGRQEWRVSVELSVQGGQINEIIISTRARF